MIDTNSKTWAEVAKHLVDVSAMHTQACVERDVDERAADFSRGWLACARETIALPYESEE